MYSEVELKKKEEEKERERNAGILHRLPGFPTIYYNSHEY
jgi:hypothetical protein